MKRPLDLCLMGASTDTGNLGVSALCLSILRGIASREPDAAVTVFDNRRGHGTDSERLDGRTFTFRRNGLHDSFRLHRRDSIWNVTLSSRLGGVGNSAVEALDRADAVLDVTGGDSFTDLYGARRFWSGCVAKRLAASRSGGLVLMPQTYGPFEGWRTRAEAAYLAGEAEMAWARDQRSFATLRNLLGVQFDEARHRCGVDVAFGLGVEAPKIQSPELRGWIEERGAPVVGINVSGLTYINEAESKRNYGLAAGYRDTVHGICDWFLARTDARIVLVPHVLTPPGHFESDRDACEAVVATLGGRARGRVLVAPDLGACGAKGLIAKMDWFCGTRMHSTIAALSSGVPCAALAYSLKTRGVFETCAQGSHVADLKALDAAAAIDVVRRSWESRDEARATLAQALPAVLATADRQMDEVLATCRRLAAGRDGAVPASESSALQSAR